MTCSVCGEGCHTTRDGKCIECIARCSCEEAEALRFELEKAARAGRRADWFQAGTTQERLDKARALGVVPESARDVRDRLGMKTREGELP